MNVHPQTGEAEYWVGSPSQPSLVEDYSVIALVRGLNPAKSVLILAGDHHHRNAGGGGVCVSAELAGGNIAAASAWRREN